MSSLLVGYVESWRGYGPFDDGKMHLQVSHSEQCIARKCELGHQSNNHARSGIPGAEPTEDLAHALHLADQRLRDEVMPLRATILVCARDCVALLAMTKLDGTAFELTRRYCLGV